VVWAVLVFILGFANLLVGLLVLLLYIFLRPPERR
jgi:hypothetical protein